MEGEPIEFSNAWNVGLKELKMLSICWVYVNVELWRNM
jgi:hypothetical protein